VTLTAKQEAFVAEYLVDLNATQAAIRAGYSANTAQEQSSRLLSNVMVSEAVAAAQLARSQRTEITQDRVLQELARIGFSDIRKLFTEDGRLRHVTMLDDDAAAMVSSIEIDVKRTMVGDKAETDAESTLKVKLWDKKGALVDIGRHLGMFKDKLEISGSVDWAAGLAERKARALKRD
jgi:phage terminase small subunit